MIPAAVAFTVFVYFLTLTLLSPLLKDLERVDRRLEKFRAKQPVQGNEELNKSFTERIILPAYTKFLKSITKISGQNSSSLQKLEKELRLAGVSMSAGEFSALRLVVLSFFLGMGALVGLFSGLALSIKILIALFAALWGLLIPRYYLTTKTKSRQKEISRQMPDIMDLLSVSVEAGLGFDAALLRVGQRSKGALIDELLNVYREIQMGKPRKDAFKSLSEKSNVEELKAFCGAVVQAEQLGISIKNVLRLQSRQLRMKRRQAAQEKAMKAPVKMMLPLVIFIFPVIFIILLGPSAIRIFQVLGGAG